MQFNWSLKKVLASSVAAVLAVSSAYAIPRGPCDTRDEVCCEQPKPGPFAFSFPKDLDLNCPRDFYFFGDFLIMQAQEDGLEYAMTDTDGNGWPLRGGTVQSFSSDGHHWDWDLGFRLGFGFYLNHDVWNLDARWTYFHYTEDTPSTVHNNATLFPFWIPPGTVLTVPANVSSSARWEMHFNTLDLSLGKPHHISRFVVFNPFFGIRAAWIDQDYHARYQGVFDGAVNAEMRGKNDYWGVGLRTGVDTEWWLGSGFNLFGLASASILFSKFDVTQEMALVNHGYEIDDEFFHNTPNFELNIGIQWGTNFNKQRHRFSLAAGYEFHYWWNMNRFRRFSDSNTVMNDVVSKGDLSINGVRIRAMFDF